MITRATLLAAVVAAVLAAAGCWGGDDNSDPTPEPPAPDTVTGKPLGPPKPKESLGDAEKRIERLVSGEDCEKINALNPVSRTGLNTPERCAYLQTLAGLEAVGKQEVHGGGVIEYANGSGVLTAILVVDSDRRYHLAFIDLVNPEPSVGTPFAPRFDQVADDAVEALREPDCERYFELAHRYGRAAALGPKEGCEALTPNPIQAVLVTAPDAKPERLGGNSRYAFYSLASTRMEVTLVLARQSNEGLPEGVPPLPANAPEYAFIDGYQATAPPD